jgi:hypothetical protein
LRERAALGAARSRLVQPVRCSWLRSSDSEDARKGGARGTLALHAGVTRLKRPRGTLTRLKRPLGSVSSYSGTPMRKGLRAFDGVDVVRLVPSVLIVMSKFTDSLTCM